MTRDRIANVLTLAILFLLPWQTVRIVNQFTMDGEPWEYGKFTIFAVELLIIALAFMRQRHVPLIGAGRPIGYGLFLLGAACISIAFSGSAALGFGALFHLTAAFALFYFLLDHRLKTEHLVLAFALGLALPAALGWFQVLTGTSPSSTLLGLASHEAATLGQSVVETQGGRVLRAYGSFPHPNIFGGFLAVGIIAIAWLVYRHRSHRHRWFILIPIAVLASTVVITFSRSSWIGVSAGFLVLMALMLWYKKVPPRDAFPFATFGLIAVFATLVLFHTVAFTRFTPSARLEAQSIETRSGEYQQVTEVFKKSPITGVGLGQYTLALAQRYPGGPAYVYQPMHNAILLILAETGVVGFLLFVRWFTSIDQINWRVRRSASGMFGMSLGTVILVLALLDHYPWSSWPGLALMAFSFALMVRWSLEGKTS